MPEIQLPFEQIDIPESHEDILVYEKHGLVWKFRRLDSEKDKFIVNVLLPNGRKAGYMTFYIMYPPENSSQIVFGGLLVSEDLRGHGLGNLCIAELFAFSQQFQVPVISAKPQGKPLTCAMLGRFGFAPHRVSRDPLVVVGRALPGAKNVPIYFDSTHTGERFIRSRVAQTGQYELVRSIEDIVDGVRVVLDKRYLLQDEAKAEVQVKRSREKLLHFD